MELVITLLQELANLSGIALYIGGLAVVLLFAYKITIIGSVYGVIKYCVGTVCDVIGNRPVIKEEKVTVKEVKYGEIRSLMIRCDGTYDRVCTMLRSLQGIRSNTNGFTAEHMHNIDADWLEEAIAEKLERDKGKELSDDKV